jgi:hypothetical protein
MKKSYMVALMGMLLGAAPLAAQDPFTAAKKAAQKSANAASAHVEAEQHPDGPQKAVAKPAAPAAPAAAKRDTIKSGTTRPGRQLNVVRSDTAGPPPTIMRELFEYSRDGRRDPFVSLLTTTDLRPTLSDLKLTGILLDHSGRNSVATLQDLTNNTKYRVSTGSTLGRMRVTAIRSMAVVFTIDEFGTTRKDSLILRASTKARAK